MDCRNRQGTSCPIRPPRRLHDHPPRRSRRRSFRLLELGGQRPRPARTIGQLRRPTNKELAASEVLATPIGEGPQRRPRRRPGRPRLRHLGRNRSNPTRRRRTGPRREPARRRLPTALGCRRPTQISSEWPPAGDRSSSTWKDRRAVVAALEPIGLRRRSRSRRLHSWTLPRRNFLRRRHQVATHCVAAKQTPSIEWGRHADIRS